MKDEFGEFEMKKQAIQRNEYAGWRLWHLAFAWVMGVCAQFSIFDPYLSANFLILLISCGTLLVTLLISFFSRVTLHDIFVQMGYREKFGVFISASLLILIPRLLGFEGWIFPMLTLTIVTALLSYNDIGFGRYYLVCVLIVCINITTNPQISSFLFAGFIASFLITIWLDFVAFRLDEYGSGEKAPKLPLMLMFGSQIAVPILITAGGWLAFQAYFGDTIRVPVFDPGPVNRSSNVQYDFLNSIIVDAIIITVIIILLVVLLNWFEKKLRRRKKGETFEENLVDATSVDILELEKQLDESLKSETENTPRIRVIRRFAEIAKSMKDRGYNRFLGETAHEYLVRISRKLLTKSELDPGTELVFLKSCYSHHHIDDKQADQYMKYADKLQTEMEEEARRLVEREAYLEQLRREQNQK